MITNCFPDLYCPWCHSSQVNICQDFNPSNYITKFWWVCSHPDCKATGPNQNSREMVIESLNIPNFYKLLFKNSESSQILELKSIVPYINVPFFTPTKAMTHQAFIATPPEPFGSKTFVKTSHQLVRLFNYNEKD